MPVRVKAKKNAARPINIANMVEPAVKSTENMINAEMSVPMAPVSNRPKFSQTQSLSV